MLPGYGYITIVRISNSYDTKKLQKASRLKEILNISHATTFFSQILFMNPRHFFKN
ncbi:hypothetical protein DWUX_2114 [Desulfovibrio diazotrophicus]|nr:hypothetical protein DWUX_2114 [Desulfovibrio diazotrophicus]